jgi:3-hydroxybutyryl-CoA dehydrogenase
MEFSRVGVVGGGTMGSGIAEVCARAGSEVIVHEVTDSRAEACLQRIAASVKRAVDKGKLPADEGDAVLARIRATADLEQLADRELVVEAVIEDLQTKLKVFAELDRIVEDPQAVLASNTSSIPIMRLAMATERRQQVVGLHFFNPVPVLRLVEVVPSLLTGPDTVERVTRYVEGSVNKHVIMSKDRAGFIVNALLIPYILSAIRMLESGFASAEDIDAGMVEGAAHPMGPLALADLIGLDTTMAVAESLYEEFKEPLYAPPPLLSRMVDAGLLGRKSGRGFLRHT